MYVCKLQPAYDNAGEQIVRQGLLLLQIQYLFKLKGQCQKVLLHSINGHLRSSLFYDYLLVSDVLDINDLLDTRSLGMYSACMAPHFPALLCIVYRHCSFPRCYTSHCVCPSLNCVFPTALCCAQITSVVSNRL